jgi:hypothetical protein
VVLRVITGRMTGESSADLQQWISQLEDCPPITGTVIAQCANERHTDEPATWFYVEADAADSVARRRCLSCGEARDVLDSAEHWTAPRMWACSSCGQSIAEVASGLHADNDQVTWVVLGARCVGCGTISGLTDFSVDAQPYDVVVAAL